MAVPVEHEKRKSEILEKALELFIEEGYEDVTFQKIADRCGITRTTLYIYFKNKREIFLWSIKQLTAELEKELLKIIADQTIDEIDCLKKMFDTIISTCEKNYQLFRVLLLYLIQLQKSGGDPEERIERRIIRMQHFLNTVIIRGEKKGSIKKVSVKAVFALLPSLMQSGIFKLSLSNKPQLEETRTVINFAIENLRP